jgi:RHS repeat-associated protein
VASNNSTTQYSYDDADRLSSVVFQNGSGVNVSKSTYAYDGLDRLRIITKFTWDTPTSAWVQQSQKKMLYDGMQVIQERDGSDNVIATNIWDGNIGGLEARVVYDIETPTNPPQKYFYHYDGSGNVTAVTDDSQQTVASYDYDAYGNLLDSSGAYASQNPWRFSTKYYDDGSGLYYYGFRFYSPGLGKWINRDPIAENGGLNLYLALANTPNNCVDPYGRYVVLDDGIVIVAGAAAGAIGQAASDVMAGKVSSLEDYDAAMVGGSVGAEVTIYAGPIAGGAAGAAASNGYQQGLNNITAEQKGVDVASLVTDTAVGAGIGALPGLKVPGVTAGRNSYASISKGLMTKLGKGTIKNIAVKSGLKKGASQVVEDAIRTGAGAVTDVARRRRKRGHPNTEQPGGHC